MGGAAADSLALTGTVDGYFDGAGGADTLVFEAVTGTSGSAQPSLVVKVTTPSVQPKISLTSLWLVVLVLTASTPQAPVTTRPTPPSLVVMATTPHFAGGATSSKIRGEAGNDTITY